MSHNHKDSQRSKELHLSKDNVQKEAERQEILTAIEAMERTKGWSIVKVWSDGALKDAWQSLYGGGKDQHDYYKGVIFGLGWIFNKIDNTKKKK